MRRCGRHRAQTGQRVIFTTEDVGGTTGCQGRQALSRVSGKWSPRPHRPEGAAWTGGGHGRPARFWLWWYRALIAQVRSRACGLSWEWPGRGDNFPDTGGSCLAHTMAGTGTKPSLRLLSLQGGEIFRSGGRSLEPQLAPIVSGPWLMRPLAHGRVALLGASIQF